MDQNRHQRTKLEAALSGLETFQIVHGGKAGLKMVKGDQLSVYRVPLTSRDGDVEGSGLGPLLSVDVFHGARRSFGEDILVGESEQRVARSIVEATADLSRPDFQQAPPEPFVVPVAA